MWAEGDGLSSIFVSYRRKDSEGEAGRLFDDLATNFGSESVFMDVSAIEPGRDFRKAIDQSVRTCSVLLAIIGQEWLESKDEQGRRRLEDENDFVRLELASALRRDIPVIPVLLRGAKMPEIQRLPEDLKDLVYRNAVELTHARWKSDVQVLIRALRLILGSDVVASTGDVSGLSVQGRRKEEEEKSSAAPARGVAGLGPEVLLRVGQELAGYVGPIAEVIVRRAAKRCCTLEELIASVAGEIEGEAARARFVKAWRS